MELAMDMMVVISDDRNADSASIERLANKLALHTVEDLRTETVAIRKLVKERGQNVETNKQIVDILSKCKQIAGLEDTGILDDPAVPKALAKCHSLAIPNEFLCPITLEIMSDPVIVATGQVIPLSFATILANTDVNTLMHEQAYHRNREKKGRELCF